MSQAEADDHTQPAITLDVAKPSNQIRFLGFLVGVGESGNDLIGAFEWMCSECGKANKDTTIVKPQQAFLTRWSCGTCSEMTFVRFVARSTAEWVAQHAMACTDKTHDGADGDEQLSPHGGGGAKPVKRGGQRLFGWISIPALITVIFLAMIDLKQPHRSSASSHPTQPGQSASTPSTRLVGYWLSQREDHVLHFDHLDSRSQRGSYVRISRSGHEDKRVEFRILYEAALGEELIIEEQNRDGGTETGATRQTTGSKVTIFVPKHRRSMIHMAGHEGSPVVTAYRRVDVTHVF